MMKHVERYMNVEELLASQKEPERGREAASPRRRAEVEKPNFTSIYNTYTSLTTRRSEILLEIKNSKNLKWPMKMQGNPEKRDKNKYCYFHWDHGHTTNECIKLKDEIEASIRRGHLDKFVAQEGRERDWERSPNRRGPAFGAKRPQFGDEITFSNRDAEGLVFPHSNPVVITVRVANFDVQRIVVDSGSSMDVLFMETFLRLGLDQEGVMPEGIISLPVRWREGKRHVNVTVYFLVINRKSAYNVILGRPSLNQIRAVVSTYHLAVKFPTNGGWPR